MTILCDQIEKFGKGVGSPSRFKIVEELFKGSKTVSQLVSSLKQSQPLISQHLKVLKESGIVKDVRQGKEILYSLNSEYLLLLLKKLTEEIKPIKNK
jgi:ArsR family transcriptional regulator, zinc-responsive transcriptional repressor